MEGHAVYPLTLRSTARPSASSPPSPLITEKRETDVPPGSLEGITEEQDKSDPCIYIGAIIYG